MWSTAGAGILITFLVIVGIAVVMGIIGHIREKGLEARADRASERQNTVRRKESCELVGRVADKHGFEYSQYRVRYASGQVRMGYRRIVPTTIAFSCPDCGGMVVGVDHRRVWPGTAGPEPTSFRCEECGRQENHDFGVPRTGEREGDMSFDAPDGARPACPRGGRHDWELVDEWEGIEFPEGVDQCTENLIFAEQVEYRRFRCAKCGGEMSERKVIS